MSEQQPIPREQFLAQAYQRGGIRETVRASLALKELTEKYPIEKYVIWKNGELVKTVGVSGQFDRYLSLNWQSYFSKLLKART